MFTDNSHYKKIDLNFNVKKEICSGNLYLPNNVKQPPVIIMGHGFAAEKCFRLPVIAERFAEAGFAVYLFDYRNFGESSGQPRNYVNPFRHLQDWHAAIGYVKNIKEIDNKRIVLWGSSFAGGHVIATAARRSDIVGIISQVPFVDGISSMRLAKISEVFKATSYGLYDVFKTFYTNKPYYVKAVGKPGEIAAMNSAESWDGYNAMIPKDSKWENKVPARIFLLLPFYSPLFLAGKVSCRSLIIAAEDDSLIPVEAVIKTSQRIKKCKLVVLKSNHFKPYFDELFEKTIKIEIDFLKELLTNNKDN
ncbi:MAG: alpha/beta hydrolase [bacterium]|nr:alpha/beta hydrolase [bacterium]